MRPRKFKKLLSDRILVELEPVKAVTRGGIVIPNTSPRPIRIGVVKKVGPGRQYRDCYRPTEIAVGDRAAFFIGSTDTKEGTHVKSMIDDNHVVIRENDVLFLAEGDVEVTL